MLDASVEQNLFEYDLATKFYYSSRTYAYPIENHVVLFAPDFQGSPFLVSKDLHKVIKGFDQGQAVGDLMATGLPAGLFVTDLLDVFAFLESRGVLRLEPTPGRYTALDLHEQKPKQVAVWLHINNQCNLDCGYCFVNKFQSQMSQETFERFADNLETTVELNDLKSVIVKFAGGEPTITLPKLKEFHFSLKERMERKGVRYRSAILSNGTAVTDKLINFLKSEHVGISISLDGFGEEGHDIYRVYKTSRKGSWKRIYRNIHLLLEHDIRPYITATISQKSSRTLPDLVDWVFSNGMATRLGVVREPEGFFLDKSEQRKAYQYLCEEMNINFERAFSLLEQDQYRFNPIKDMVICELRFAQPSFSAPCGIGNSHIVVQDDGRITACPMTIRESSVVPRSDLLIAVQDSYDLKASARNDRSDNCLDCNWYPVCVSGCPVNNQRANGDPYSISPLHEFYQYVIPRFLRFTGLKLWQEAKRKQLANNLVIDLF